MIRIHLAGHRSRGFSLLEVMIAVVVLATGLLALAALQGSLTRSSAEAKVRGRVAAMLSARMDELRATGYGSLTPTPTPVTTTSTSGDCDTATPDATDWIDCTRQQAGLGSLSVVMDIKEWSGTGVFTQTPPSDPDEAQFKRISLTATWTDAGANGHQLALASDISVLGLTNSLIPPPDDQDSGSGGPTVRTTNPATAGVIPIALGNGDSSAASNPTPELVGQKNNEKIVGTKFNVLTYTPDGAGAVIQKRFENDVIKCKCQYGAGGTNLPEIYRTAQWPAIWTGDHYEVYKPSPAANAPGQSFSSGPASGVEQSPLCQECCRDHHDTAATGVAKFDPERTGGYQKYNLNGSNTLVTVPDTSSAVYFNSCRIIRVDGLWRTASDMYARNFGLLETETVAGAKAKTGLPTTAATDAYTAFVKDYLAQYDGSVGTAPGNAQTMFDDVTRGLNNPALVTIAAASNTDFRYLHARGLYVDYLEDQARALLADVVADTAAGGRCDQTTSPAKAMADCVLPYLPFTSANLTEIAKWLASNTSVLTVNSGNLLATNPAQPSGSRSIGNVVGTSDNTASARKSNSGVAVNTGTAFTNLNGVDPDDDTAIATDVQPFQVGGTVNSGPAFDVRVSGGGANPFVFFTILTDVNQECLKPAGSDHHCVTSTGTTLPQAGSIKVSNYWLETTASRSITAQCYDGATLYTVTDTISVPTFRNYIVSAASIGGVNGTIQTPAANDNKKTESTTIDFTGITAGGLILVTLAEQTGSPTYATIASGNCTTNGGHNKINSPTWTKSWELP
jgi:prepilin-type N-terminal cleavage/methylation domain-containing protein